MSFFRLKKEMKDQDPVLYWRLIFLKGICFYLIFPLVYVYFTALSRDNSVDRIFLHPLFIVTISACLYVFLFVNTRKKQIIGASVLCGIGLFASILLPYLHEGGYRAPFYLYYSILLFFSYALLGIKASLITFALLLFTLICQVSGIPENLNHVLKSTFDFPFYELFRVRITSLIFSSVLVFTFHKITTSMANQIIEGNLKAEKLSKYDVLSKIAAGFAHEINNPLAIIKGNAQVIKEGRSKEDVNKRATTIEKGVARISSIVANFLAIFSKEEVFKSKWDLFDLINKVFESNEKFQPEINIPKNTYVETNFDLLQEVILELSENALMASPSSKKPIKWVYERNRLICIDEGRGFEKMEFEEALKPFVTTGGSPGLGLFKVQTLCEKIDAKLEYERRNNQTYLSILFHSY